MQPTWREGNYGNIHSSKVTFIGGCSVNFHSSTPVFLHPKPGTTTSVIRHPVYSYILGRQAILSPSVSISKCSNVYTYDLTWV